LSKGEMRVWSITTVGETILPILDDLIIDSQVGRNRGAPKMLFRFGSHNQDSQVIRFIVFNNFGNIKLRRCIGKDNANY